MPFFYYCLPNGKVNWWYPPYINIITFLEGASIIRFVHFINDPLKEGHFITENWWFRNPTPDWDVFFQYHLKIVQKPVNSGINYQSNNQKLVNTIFHLHQTIWLTFFDDSLRSSPLAPLALQGEIGDPIIYESWIFISSLFDTHHF